MSACSPYRLLLFCFFISRQSVLIRKCKVVIRKGMSPHTLSNRKNKVLNVLIALLLAGGMFFSVFGVFAATGVPKIFSYQGRLLDSSGNLLGGSGTDFCFRFSFYSDATVGSPDTKLWPTSDPSTMTVNVEHGVFNVDIGSGIDTLDFNFQTTDTTYLNVEVASQIANSCSGVSFDNLAPRQRISSTGYSINSDTVDGFHAAQSASGSQVTALTSGNLILGGVNPQFNATSSNTLTLQGGAGTGDIRFFSAANKLTSAGNLTIASNFNALGYASASQYFSGGLSTCNGSTFLQWTSGLFGCGTPSGGSSFTGLAMHEGTTTAAHITDLKFDAGAFNFSNIASSGTLFLDYTNGPASRSIDQAITGAWTFNAHTAFGSSASISGSFDPGVDNTYSLGNSDYRWKSINVGPGSFNITSTGGNTGVGAAYTLGQITFGSGSSLSFGTYNIGTGSKGSLEFKTASTSRMFISSGGNVGIGTTSTTQKLTLSGNIGFTNGPQILDAAGRLQLQAGGTGTGSTGTGSIYFLDSSAVVRGRVDTTSTAPTTFSGGNQSANDIQAFVTSMFSPSDVAPTAGGTLTINGVSLGSYDYTVKTGNQTVSSFVSTDWFTSTADTRSAFVVVIGDLTISSGQVFKPAGRKLFTVIYVTGTLSVNGELSMSQRGASHSATTAGAILIYTGTLGSVVNPNVPAVGGAGAPSTTAGATGAAGTSGTATLGSGGGGAGGGFSGTSTGGAGSAGTSFSGGTAGGGAGAVSGGAGAANGGAGGATTAGGGFNLGGGAGNPGGAGAGSGSAGSSGTGGTLIVISVGAFSGSGTVTSAGSAGGGGGDEAGGGSGGGHITVIYGTDSGPTPNVAGGVGGGGINSGGAGGAGYQRKLSGVFTSANSPTLNGYGTLYIGATNTTSADLAEYYVIHDSSLGAGDAVSVNFDGSGYGLVKARDPDYPIGIVSTNPGFILGGGESDKSDQRLVALVGRVPTKVSTENGPIRVGDRLGLSSSEPGVAVRAVHPGDAIGLALENFGPDLASGSLNNLTSGSLEPVRNSVCGA